MKKLIAIVTLIVCLLLCSCGTEMQSVEDSSNYSMFVQVERNADVGYVVVYHRDTKVMYAISDGRYNHGTFTVMLNPDGTPMLYGGAE